MKSTPRYDEMPGALTSAQLGSMYDSERLTEHLVEVARTVAQAALAGRRVDLRELLAVERALQADERRSA